MSRSPGLAGPGGPFPKGYGVGRDADSNRVQSDYQATWYSFRKTTADLMESTGAANAEAAALLLQIQTNAAFLGSKWDTWFKTNSTSVRYPTGDEYLTSLHGDLRVLRRISKEKEQRAALDALRDVALDLQIKADNCRGSTDGLGKEILVRVHTKSGGKEIGGFEVCYVPKGLLDVKGAQDRFPRQSSPTDERTLNPGRYAMWVRKRGFTGEPVILSIGGHGETRCEIDLEVPTD